MSKKKEKKYTSVQEIRKALLVSPELLPQKEDESVEARREEIKESIHEILKNNLQSALKES